MVVSRILCMLQGPKGIEYAGNIILLCDMESIGFRIFIRVALWNSAYAIATQISFPSKLSPGRERISYKM